jgi:NhaA family Na+:H+ antiporter
VLDQLDRAYYDRVLTDAEFVANEQHIAEVARLAMYATSPLERLESRLSPWVTFVIVPVFALANAGVELTGDALSGITTDPVVLGVALGLVVGKTAGVFLAALVAVRLGLGTLPPGTSWRHVLGLAMCAGVGFTVALFVTSISLTDPAVAGSAKLGILLGSAVAGAAGYLFLRAVPDRAEAQAPVWALTAATPAAAASGSR